MPKNFTVREVSVLFRRSTWTIYRWIGEGKLNSLKVNDGHLISEAEINRFMRECKKNNINPRLK